MARTCKMLLAALLAVGFVTTAHARGVAQYPPIGTPAYDETCYLLPNPPRLDEAWVLAHCEEDGMTWGLDLTGSWTCDGLPGWVPFEGPLPYCPDDPNDPRGKA